MQHNESRRTQVRPKPPVDFEGEETAPRALEAERLRRVVRALGLDDHVPEDDGQMRDACSPCWESSRAVWNEQRRAYLHTGRRAGAAALASTTR
jgi:hypothetical protein